MKKIIFAAVAMGLAASSALPLFAFQPQGLGGAWYDAPSDDSVVVPDHAYEFNQYQTARRRYLPGVPDPVEGGKQVERIRGYIFLSNVRTADDKTRNGRLRIQWIKAHIKEYNPNFIDDDGWTPLMCAQNAEVARILIDAGADPNLMTKLSTALRVAQAYGRNDVVGVLLSAGAHN